MDNVLIDVLHSSIPIKFILGLSLYFSNVSEDIKAITENVEYKLFKIFRI